MVTAGIGVDVDPYQGYVWSEVIGVLRPEYARLIPPFFDMLTPEERASAFDEAFDILAAFAAH